MAGILQFYGDGGVPLRVDGGVEEPAIAWRSQRTRLRAWLDAVPDAEWNGPTRCELWDMSALVRHMASASQFLGYTLHEAARGTATCLLRDFDSHETVQAASATLGDMTPSDTQDVLGSMDAAVDVELDRMREIGWSVLAEAPPGQLPSHLAVSHFLFDSWVHEYDLMLPRGERPLVDPFEAEVTVRYLIGLAEVATGARTPLELCLTDPELWIGVAVTAGIVEVTVGSAPADAPTIEGRVLDLVDRTTGRQGGALRGDDRALAVIDDFARLLAA
jgi:Mycothiol maleylpyruvate isomerase N-terminal domain